jgi:hypothetical protein
MSETSAQGYQHEVKAIGDVLALLDPLTGPARERVMAYVINALNIGIVAPTAELPQQHAPTPPVLDSNQSVGTTPPVLQRTNVDIRSLRESKQPRSAVEMAAVVAYYLSESAPDGERKDAIGAADLDKYFKQAGFRLPKKQNMTLVNAASAGYFDRVGQGQYKLNPVGYNLVAHNLPTRSTESTPRSRPAQRAKPAKSQGTKKASPAKKASAAKKPSTVRSSTR